MTQSAPHGHVCFETGDSKHHGREESEGHTNNQKKVNLKALILGITRWCRPELRECLQKYLGYETFRYSIDWIFKKPINVQTSRLKDKITARYFIKCIDWEEKWSTWTDWSGFYLFCSFPISHRPVLKGPRRHFIWICFSWTYQAHGETRANNSVV